VREHHLPSLGKLVDLETSLTSPLCLLSCVNTRPSSLGKQSVAATEFLDSGGNVQQSLGCLTLHAACRSSASFRPCSLLCCSDLLLASATALVNYVLPVTGMLGVQVFSTVLWLRILGTHLALTGFLMHNLTGTHTLQFTGGLRFWRQWCRLYCFTSSVCDLQNLSFGKHGCMPGHSPCHSNPTPDNMTMGQMLTATYCMHTCQHGSMAAKAVRHP
jgi:hypothetical protein